MRALKSITYLFALAFILSACRTTKPIVDTNVIILTVDKYDSVLQQIPDYSNSLKAVSGKGRAIVSEPNNSDRVTIEFETDSSLSRLTIKNRIGIVGGVMLVDQDSILIYNKIDKEAQKVAIVDSRRTSLNELASINLLDLLNYKIESSDVARIEDHYSEEKTTLIYFKSGGYAWISGNSGKVEYVEKPRSSGLPYSAIKYENYGSVDGYTLPRKITILSADEASKVIFQIRSLSVNPNSLDLSLEIPNSIPIQRI